MFKNYFRVYKLYSKQRRTYRQGITIFLILAILLAIITLYGQNTGNFVISIDEDFERSLTLSKDPTFSVKGPRLIVNAVEGSKDITYSWLNIEMAKKTNGDYIDPRNKYLSFTFYLRNEGTESMDVGFLIEVLEEQNNLGNAIRVLVIEDDNDETMYMREDTVPWYYEDEALKNAIHFESPNLVCNRTISNFRPSQTKKFTLMMWLEGEDPDCVDDLANGRIKMRMIFTAKEE